MDFSLSASAQACFRASRVRANGSTPAKKRSISRRCKVGRSSQVASARCDGTAQTESESGGTLDLFLPDPLHGPGAFDARHAPLAEAMGWSFCCRSCLTAMRRTPATWKFCIAMARPEQKSAG